MCDFEVERNIPKESRIITSDSPFLLSMKGAKIYDLDEDRVDVKKWTELENVRTYYEFFKKHGSEFEK